MQQHRGKREQCEFDTKGYNNWLEAGSQGWHYGAGDNYASANVLSRSPLSMTPPNLHSQFRGQISELPNSGSILLFECFSQSSVSILYDRSIIQWDYGIILWCSWSWNLNEMYVSSSKRKQIRTSSKSWGSFPLRILWSWCVIFMGCDSKIAQV